MADDIDQQLVDVRRKIQEAEAKETAALAMGPGPYQAVLAQITSLQNEKLFLMQLQQNQGEQRCAMHGEIVTTQRNLGPLDTIKRESHAYAFIIELSHHPCLCFCLC